MDVLILHEHYKRFAEFAECREDAQGGVSVHIPVVGEVKEVNEDKFLIKHFISTPRIDYVYDIMNPLGVDTLPLEKNRSVFYNHKWNGSHDLPIGKNVWIKKTPEGVLALTRYAADVIPFARDVFNLAARGYLNSYSIGFHPKVFRQLSIAEWKNDPSSRSIIVPNINEFTDNERVVFHEQWQVYEYSQVGVPMNMDAVSVKQLAQKALNDGAIQSELARYILKEFSGLSRERAPEITTTQDEEEVEQDEKASTVVQSLILSKEVFTSVDDAKKWVKEHGFRADKVDETEDSYRFRQRDPSDFEPDSFRTITLRKGVKAVIGRLKERKLAEDIEDPVRWAKSWSKAFDIEETNIEPETQLLAWIAEFCRLPLKKISEAEFVFPGVRLGQYLAALEEVIGRSYHTLDLRNITENGKERPPVFDTIPLNSRTSLVTCIEGVRFLQDYTDLSSLVIQSKRMWAGVRISLYGSAEAVELFQNRYAEEVPLHRYLRGEAFSVSGDFLQRGVETWDDLVLNSEVLACVKRAAGALQKERLNMRTSGMVFAGPPGNGKTHTARVIMNMLKDVTFVSVNARDMMRMGAFGGVSYAFDLARENAPAVVFFDDTDRWLLNSDMVEYVKAELDGLQRSKGMLVIFATNNLNQLPESLIDRPGRIDDILRFEFPDKEARLDLVRRWASGEEIDEELNARLEGFSCAHIREICEYAVQLAGEKNISMREALCEAVTKIERQRELLSLPKHYRIPATVKIQMFPCNGAWNRENDDMESFESIDALLESIADDMEIEQERKPEAGTLANRTGTVQLDFSNVIAQTVRGEVSRALGRLQQYVK